MSKYSHLLLACTSHEEVSVEHPKLDLKQWTNMQHLPSRTLLTNTHSWISISYSSQFSWCYTITYCSGSIINHGEHPKIDLQQRTNIHHLQGTSLLTNTHSETQNQPIICRSTDVISTGCYVMTFANWWQVAMVHKRFKAQWTILTSYQNLTSSGWQKTE